MKDKIKRFIIEKKELLIFIGVVIFVFTAVITIATLSIGNDQSPPVITPPVDDGSKPVEELPDPVTPIEEKFVLPVTSDYVVVRTFFDKDKTDEELVSAIIVENLTYTESKGISYATEDDKEFDVVAIYDGIVTDIKNDDLAGATITIKHSDDVYSIYSSLTDVKVSVGKPVEGGSKIATSSSSTSDVGAGVHVHLQVKVNNKYINPELVYGKYLDSLTDSK
jgi:stage II sporulation protein Q